VALKRREEAMKGNRVNVEHESSVPTVLCPEDPEERVFNACVRLWVGGEISHSALMKNYPEYDSTMMRRIMNVIAARFE
jgi:hypothetical protein